MPRMTSEKREEMFREMRERQQKLRLVRGAPPPDPEPAKPEPAAKRELPELGRDLEMFRVKEVARMLKISEASVTRWFRNRAICIDGPGLLKGRRRKQLLLIPRVAIEAWLREHYQGRTS